MYACTVPKMYRRQKEDGRKFARPSDFHHWAEKKKYIGKNIALKNHIANNNFKLYSHVNPGKQSHVT